MTYKGYVDKEKRKEYLKNYMTDFREREKEQHAALLGLVEQMPKLLRGRMKEGQHPKEGQRVSEGQRVKLEELVHRKDYQKALELTNEILANRARETNRKVRLVVKEEPKFKGQSPLLGLPEPNLPDPPQNIKKFELKVIQHGEEKTE
jgi:hypothetical protein